MTPQEATDLAERIFAVFDREAADRALHGYPKNRQHAADRERVASDLVVWRKARSIGSPFLTVGAEIGAEAEASLRRTARLYDITP